MAQAGGSFGNVLNPKPATNEGHPPSLSQREKGRTRTGSLAGLLSQTEPSKGRLTASLACVPAPRNGKLPSPWLPGHTQKKNVGEGLGSSLGTAGVLPSILFEDLTLNLFQGPQTSLTTQAPVPFASCAANPLKPIRFPTALSSSSLDTPNTPGPGAPHSPVHLSRPASVQAQDPGRSLCFAQKFPLGPPGSPRLRF